MRRRPDVVYKVVRAGVPPVASTASTPLRSTVIACKIIRVTNVIGPRNDRIRSKKVGPQKYDATPAALLSEKRSQGGFRNGGEGFQRRISGQHLWAHVFSFVWVFLVLYFLWK